VKVGQIVQIKMKFRLLKQESGEFTFRELLKGIYVLHDGMSMVRRGIWMRQYIINANPLQDIARSLAVGAASPARKAHRDVKFYTVGRPKARHTSAMEESNEGDAD
jgi:hypothetical protein